MPPFAPSSFIPLALAPCGPLRPQPSASRLPKTSDHSQYPTTKEDPRTFCWCSAKAPAAVQPTNSSRSPLSSLGSSAQPKPTDRPPSPSNPLNFPENKSTTTQRTQRRRVVRRTGGRRVLFSCLHVLWAWQQAAGWLSKVPRRARCPPFGSRSQLSIRARLWLTPFLVSSPHTPPRLGRCCG